MPLNSRAKGKRGELALAAFLRSWGHSGARRGQQFSGSSESPDVVGVPGHHFECKLTQKLELYSALDQAIAECGANVPVVAHRKNGKAWVAVMRLDDLMKLIALAQKNGRPPK